jgi:DNA mismatch repair protein MutS
MSFFADKQTQDDLNIQGRQRNNSIARLFDTAVTTGGRKLMDSMFQQPLNNVTDINSRSSIFKYFAGQAIAVPFTGEEFGLMEEYLSSGQGSSLAASVVNVVSKKVLQIAVQDKEYVQLHTAVSKTIVLLNQFHTFINRLPDEQSPYKEQLDSMKNILANPKLKWLQDEAEVKRLSLAKLIKFDYLLRTGLQKQLQELIQMIFLLDVYIAVSAVGKLKGFCYGLALPGDRNTITATGLYHPIVENAIGNTLVMHQDKNVLFLTGANMAGKSTLMKSFGVAIYLAHMGFPVAASHMEFSVKDGLYSSINVPDNLSMGYSHFYAEVLRIKTVAQQVAADKNLVVIFDELFKGTNVKDAYDATLAITGAFSENRNCLFVISTHIIEVGETLRKQCNNFRFAYLPTEMNGLIPRYTYQLKEGITSDRHGMMIIENEGILDIIRAGGGKPMGDN